METMRRADNNRVAKKINQTQRKRSYSSLDTGYSSLFSQPINPLPYSRPDEQLLGVAIELFQHSHFLVRFIKAPLEP